MRYAWLMLGCAAACGQAPAVSSVTKAPGDPVQLELSLASQPGKAPVAVRWDVIFPAQLMGLEGDGPDKGSAAVESGKSLVCTQLKPYAYSCNLEGGAKPIADGSVAVFHFRIAKTAAPGSTTLRIEKIVATTPDAKVQSLVNTESIVVIR
jgi:hypothetical protein